MYCKTAHYLPYSSKIIAAPHHRVVNSCCARFAYLANNDLKSFQAAILADAAVYAQTKVKVFRTAFGAPDLTYSLAY